VVIQKSERYRQQVDRINKSIAQAEEVARINATLNKYNWVFVHPYSQGFQIDYVKKLISSPASNDLEVRVFELYARRFLDLDYTISMLDGFYQKRPFLNQFFPSIEESIVLALQKDFSGAIHLLIPAIEGTIRNYLVSKNKGKAATTTNIEKLRKAFRLMREDYSDLVRNHANKENRYYRIEEYDHNQVKQIVKLESFWFSIWIEQLENYLVKNLYADTRNKIEIGDKFNRHNMVHGFGSSDYSFRNFLRLLSCINFLSWAIGTFREDCSILAEIDEDKFQVKYQNYVKILAMSEAMTVTKSAVFGKEIVSFEKFMSKDLIALIGGKSMFQQSANKNMERLINPKQYWWFDKFK
jgi:ribosomal protein L9